jgi:dCMP deaminase
MASKRISWHTYFSELAQLIAKRSPCDRLHVGCVLVKDNRVIATGYNGFLPGSSHVSIVYDNHEQATVHAEQNAIADCAKRGVATEGAIAYVTHCPCINCYKVLVASGIRHIYYLYDYKNDITIWKLIRYMNAKVFVEKIEPEVSPDQTQQPSTQLQ